jgi:hypothetical protein
MRLDTKFDLEFSTPSKVEEARIKGRPFGRPFLLDAGLLEAGFIAFIEFMETSIL